MSRQSVNKTVLNAAPGTASVAIGGLLVMLLIAFPVGILSALRPRSKLDRGAMMFTLASISLPTFWVGLVAAYYIRMIRATLMEAMAEDYVKVARVKGASERRVIGSHALRNSVLPIVTMLGMDLGFVLGGLFFLEYVFALPGLGNTALDSITTFDLPVTMGVVIFGTLTILIANLIVDLL